MEIQILSRAFPFRSIDRYWLSLTDSTTSCGWNNYPAATNCQYLKDLLTKIQNNFGIPASIIASRDSWYKVFKDYYGCPDVSNWQFWWIPTTSNQQPNFNDYVQVGGWHLPYAKMLSSKSICGMSLV